ncbi:MAG: peptidylprolyl isomerase [Anaerolineae bacterium]
MWKLSTAAACALLLSACGGSGDASSNGAQSAPTSTSLNAQPPATALPTQDFSALPTDDSGQRIVARVNGQSISLDAYQKTLARYALQQYEFADVEAMESAVMGTLVQQTLINQASVQQNVAITDDDLNAELQNYIEEAGGEAAWETWLVNNGYTADEFRASLRDSLTINRMRDQVTLVVLGDLPQVHARHILVSDLNLANTILQQLQSGADFAALAAQYSIDITTKDNGGDLGWFTREELIDPSLADVAFTMEPGSIAGPVPTALGYHIIQTLERGNRPVDEANRPQLAEIFFNRWLDSLTESSTIEYFLHN